MHNYLYRITIRTEAIPVLLQQHSDIISLELGHRNASRLRFAPEPGARHVTPHRSQGPVT